MMKHQVRSPADALAYITDCTLATVTTMAMQKSRSNYEFRRQKSIAQTAIDWMKSFNIPLDSRAIEADAMGSVDLWADQYDIKKKKPP